MFIEIERWWSLFSKDLKSFPLMMQTKFQEAGKWVFRLQVLTDLALEQPWYNREYNHIWLILPKD
jgi:hypothetical protein